MRKSMLASLSLALLAAACAPPGPHPYDPANDVIDEPSGGSSSGTGTDEDAANPTKVVGKLSFAASNLPAGTELAATGDWIVNRSTCDGREVTLDTVSGETSCKGAPITFQTVKVNDPTYGELTMGVFVTRNLVIEPDMRIVVSGNRPLVLVALETAKIQGMIDASEGGGGGFLGVGGNKGGGPGGGAPSGARSNGGGGGGYCGTGGTAGSGSLGGKSYGSETLIPLIGGSAGGGASAPGGSIEGGAGGGAVQIVAGTSLEVAGLGAIHVGGGCGTSVFGIGGGAGGGILLEAPSISVLGTLAANGAAGGSEYHAGGFGTPDANPAKGGVDSSGTGGNGSAGTVTAGGDAIPIPSLAGGGGGAGRIRINGTTVKIGEIATISPSLTTPCATQGKLGAL